MTILNSGRINRRGFMATTAGAALIAGLPLRAKAAPSRGGHLRAAIGHGQTTDTLDPGTWSNSFTTSLGFAIHGRLTEVAAIGVADENDRAVLPVQHTLGCRDIVGERGQRVLHDAHIIATRGQLIIDPAPPGSVGECTVDKDDVRDGVGIDAEGDTAGQGCGGQGFQGIGHGRISFVSWNTMLPLVVAP